MKRQSRLNEEPLFCRCGRCPSEEDPLVPFDPPLVSKYGPISRCARALVRGPAPIQVSAASHRGGDLTSPTAALRHPLPSASQAPSLYALAAQGESLVTLSLSLSLFLSPPSSYPFVLFFFCKSAAQLLAFPRNRATVESIADEFVKYVLCVTKCYLYSKRRSNVLTVTCGNPASLPQIHMERMQRAELLCLRVSVTSLRASLENVAPHHPPHRSLVTCVPSFSRACIHGITLLERVLIKGL